MALDLRDQHPDRPDHPVPRVPRGARGPRARPRGQGRRGGRHAVRARARRHDLRPDRAAAARLGRPGGVRDARRRRRAVHLVPRLGVAHLAPDAPAGVCSSGATSRWGTSRPSRCTAGWACCSSSSFCSSSRWPGYNALEAGSASIPVTIVMFLFSMRFGAMADKYGPRFFMGVGPLVAAARPGLVPAPRRRRGLPDRPAARPARVRGRPVDDGRPAHGHGAGRRRRGQRGHRLGGQQRDREGGQPGRDRRGGRRGGVGVRLRR